MMLLSVPAVPLLRYSLCLLLAILVHSLEVKGSGERKRSRSSTTEHSASTSNGSFSVNEQYHNNALSNPFTEDPKYFRDDFSTVKDGQPPAWVANRYKIYHPESGIHYDGDYFGYDALPLRPEIHGPDNWELYLHNNMMRYHLGEYPDMAIFHKHRLNEEAKQRSLKYISDRRGKTIAAVHIPEVGLVLYHNRTPDRQVKECFDKGHMPSLLCDTNGYLYMMHPYIEENQ